MLTISVKNFGPIAEGSVDLKPLTIFVGPSNTGKSYMATAVYAVMKGFEGPYHWSYRIRPQPDEQGRTPLQWQATSGRLLMARGAGSDAADALLKWAAQLPKDKLITREIFSSDLPQDLWAEVEHSILVMLDIIAQEAIARISDTYGDPSSFVRREIGNEDFCVNLYRHEPLLSLDIQLDSNGKLSPDFDISRIPIRQPNLGPMLERETSDSNSETYVRSGSMSFLMLLDSATEPLFDKLPPQTLYLPASRSGLIQVYKVLSAAIVRQSSAVRVHNPDRSTLPGTTTDFLSNLLSLDDRGSTEEDDDYLQNAIGFIETAVLQGKIILDKSGWLPYPEITYESKTGKFALNQTSSMVSELAPLILFLKYLVRPGDLLILEEPESGLHPAAQRQLARGIVRLVNAGVKVLITTHSDIIISQINNLLALRQASPELIEQGGFEPEDFLQPEQVGAYLFRYSQEQGGCETVSLEIDPDTGIDEDEFAAVFEAIYDESIALQRDRN